MLASHVTGSERILGCLRHCLQGEIGLHVFRPVAETLELAKQDSIGLSAAVSLGRWVLAAAGQTRPAFAANAFKSLAAYPYANCCTTTPGREKLAICCVLRCKLTSSGQVSTTLSSYTTSGSFQPPNRGQPRIMILALQGQSLGGLHDLASPASAVRSHSMGQAS